MKLLQTLRLFGSLFVISAAASHAQDRNVARIVVWQPKPGMTRDMEEGYKRHLEWHRSNADTWTWYGWNIISGDHDGYFTDGTFFHAWSDFDHPVSPAADVANNEINVAPFADIRSISAYEAVPALTNLAATQLSSTLLTFMYFQIESGRGREFESLVSDALRQLPQSQVKYALLRPANGTVEYLLLLPADKQSDLGEQAGFTGSLMQFVAQHAKEKSGESLPLIQSYRTETARFRQDMSYIPETKVH